MENNEKNVLENSAENVAATATEENVDVSAQSAESEKIYTQEDFDREVEKKAKELSEEIVDKRIPRREAKIRKEFERKYGRLESVLKAGTGKEDVKDIADTFEQYYQGRGIKIPAETAEPNYSANDIAVLAKSEADEIIKSGFDEVVEEVNRLSQLGVKNMSSREKAVFKLLGEHRKNVEKIQELSKLGVSEDVYNSPEFKSFASKFNSDTSISDIYDIYTKTKPKKEIETMGSMKNSVGGDKEVKDFYTRDEALKFSRKDLDKNPELVKAIEKSMLKW